MLILSLLFVVFISYSRFLASLFIFFDDVTIAEVLALSVFKWKCHFLVGLGGFILIYFSG